MQCVTNYNDTEIDWTHIGRVRTTTNDMLVSLVKEGHYIEIPQFHILYINTSTRKEWEPLYRLKLTEVSLPSP